MKFSFLAVLTLAATNAFAADVYKDVFQAIDKGNIESRLRDMSGANPVTVGGQTFTIKERKTEANKVLFRKYWLDYFQKLGLQTDDASYPGHNLEAILPGRTTDTIVIVVHYDSAGVLGNAGADDDMSGMTTMLEAARILSGYAGRLQNTIRWVATDFEETGLQGATKYASWLKREMASKGFKTLLAIDYEQSGWSGASKDKFYVTNNCIKTGTYKDMLQRATSVATTYGVRLQPTNWECYGGSDHSAFLDVGIPAFFSSEFNPLANPYFDQSGDDISIIDSEYLFKISQIMITLTAQVVGIN